MWLAGFDHLPRRHSDIVFFPLTRPVIRPGSGPSPGISLSSPEPAAETRFTGWFAEFSPNGRYVAYQSDESGRDEVYVRPFPQVDRGRWQISTAGGTRPAWARSGRELFYLDASNTLTTVPVQTSGSTFSAGKPAKVFDTKYAEPNPARHYDVSPDGQRFLMLKAARAGDPNATPASMVVVLNWFEELKQRVPAKLTLGRSVLARGLTSDEHFTVDGTLLEASASIRPLGCATIHVTPHDGRRHQSPPPRPTPEVTAIAFGRADCRTARAAITCRLP